MRAYAKWWLVAALLAAPVASLAQTDEIQVYDANIADKGKFNLMIHNNFTPVGLKEPAFPGAVESNHALVGVAEWAYGVTDWFEQGLYLPLYSFSHSDGAKFNGFKIRELFVRPHADERKFFFGVNFEFSVNQKQWDPRRYTSEVRPIIGWHLHPVDIIVNPIMDTSYTGGFKSLDFAPAVRVAYNFSPKWAGSIEEYADYGPFREIYSAHEQSHQESKYVNIETGIGFGLTGSSDRVTLKLMLSRDLN
jgi:opacity protein-like surface antigen